MSAAATDSPSYYLLTYHYVEDIAEKRGPHRAEHIERIKALEASGNVVLGGAFGKEPKGAVIIFKNYSEQEIAAFVEGDPYVKNQLVPSYTIEPYAVVIGG